MALRDHYRRLTGAEVVGVRRSPSDYIVPGCAAGAETIIYSVLLVNKLQATHIKFELFVTDTDSTVAEPSTGEVRTSHCCRIVSTSESILDLLPEYLRQSNAVVPVESPVVLAADLLQVLFTEE